MKLGFKNDQWQELEANLKAYEDATVYSDKCENANADKCRDRAKRILRLLLQSLKIVPKNRQEEVFTALWADLLKEWSDIRQKDILYRGLTVLVFRRGGNTKTYFTIKAKQYLERHPKRFRSIDDD